MIILIIKYRRHNRVIPTRHSSICAYSLACFLIFISVPSLCLVPCLFAFVVNEMQINCQLQLNKILIYKGFD